MHHHSMITTNINYFQVNAEHWMQCLHADHIAVSSTVIVIIALTGALRRFLAAIGAVRSANTIWEKHGCSVNS